MTRRPGGGRLAPDADEPRANEALVLADRDRRLPDGVSGRHAGPRELFRGPDRVRHVHHRQVRRGVHRSRLVRRHRQHDRLRSGLINARDRARVVSRLSQ